MDFASLLSMCSGLFGIVFALALGTSVWQVLSAAIKPHLFSFHLRAQLYTVNSPKASRIYPSCPANADPHPVFLPFQVQYVPTDV